MSPSNLKSDVPSSGGVLPKMRGRPSGAVDQDKISAFMHVIKYMEYNDKLHEIMEKEVGRREVY